MKASRGLPLTLLLALSLSACNSSTKPAQDNLRQITVTTPQTKTVSVAQQFAGQIRSHHRIEVRAPETGLLVEVPIKEWQEVKQDDLLFQIQSTFSTENRETKHDHQLVSIKAPFDGELGRLLQQKDSFVKKGDPLISLSDNNEMWVYFNVPEARYLDFKTANLDQNRDDFKIELVLANGQKFDQTGQLGAIGAVFDIETGSVSFRADFPNPNHQLHHGQHGTVLISRMQKDAIVIPQRAVFEVLNKRYVYVVAKDDVVHQRPIDISNEFDDQFVIKSGINLDEKIVADGVRLLRDGEKVKYDDHSKKVATNQK